MVQLLEPLREKYGCDTPIFTNEIYSLFPEYAQEYISRVVKSIVDEGGLVHVTLGTYYIPQGTPSGTPAVTADDIARKRYIQSGENIYGIYGGLTLKNEFSVTTQTPDVLEIVTNNETSRRREISIVGVPFVLRSSRTEITSGNADIYRILQLFTETNEPDIHENVLESVMKFIDEKHISRESLLKMGMSFPARTLKNMTDCRII